MKNESHKVEWFQIFRYKCKIFNFSHTFCQLINLLTMNQQVWGGSINEIVIAGWLLIASVRIYDARSKVSHCLQRTVREDPDVNNLLLCS